MCNIFYKSTILGEASYFDMDQYGKCMNKNGILQENCIKNWKFKNKESAPSGPEMTSKYKPGTHGGNWNIDEVAITKKRIQALINSHWSDTEVSKEINGKILSVDTKPIGTNKTLIYFFL